MEDNEQLSIVKSVRFGMDDRDRVSLYLDVMHSESTGSVHYFWEPNEWTKIITDAQVRDVGDLKGKPCITRHELRGAGGKIEFVRMVKI